jgi:ribosome-associated protein
LSKSVLPKAPKTARKTSTQAAALKAQPDADKTLNMILSRLDDMKAEERSPSTFAANLHFRTT